MHSRNKNIKNLFRGEVFGKKKKYFWASNKSWNVLIRGLYRSNYNTEFLQLNSIEYEPQLEAILAWEDLIGLRVEEKKREKKKSIWSIDRETEGERSDEWDKFHSNKNDTFLRRTWRSLRSHFGCAVSLNINTGMKALSVKLYGENLAHMNRVMFVYCNW